MRVAPLSRFPLAFAAAVLAAVAPPRASAQTRQDAPSAPRVSAEPARPAQGTLFAVVVRPARATDSVVAARGRAAGEPLHFERADSGALRAFAAAPLGTTGTLRVTVVAARLDGRVDTLALDVPVAPGAYEVEKLRVAPQFGTKPDSALQARIDLEYERAQATGSLSHETPRLWRQPFARPRPGRVTSGFGRAREFNGQVQSRHTGTDFAGAVGEPVYAANRGVVAIVDQFFLGGNVIYVDHGAGLVTAYLHLSRAEVAPGDTVARGQVIGRVGATGRVTGPHLHFIARYGGVSVDPLTLPGMRAAVGDTAARAAVKR